MYLDNIMNTMTMANSAAFRVGEEFYSFEKLQDRIISYQEANYVQLYIRSSRSVEAAVRRAPARKFLPKLKYSEVDYYCIHGGKNFKSRSTGNRPNISTYQMHCPFGVKIRASLDGLRLVIKTVIAEHNHKVSKIMPVSPGNGYVEAGVLESAALRAGEEPATLQPAICKAPVDEFPKKKFKFNENRFQCLPVPGEFLTLHQVFQILERTDAPLTCIPGGEKSNVCFVIRITENEKRKVKLRNPFSDDFSAWDRSLSTISTNCVVLDNDRVPTVVNLKDDKYCFEKRSNGMVHWIPLQPQPEKFNIIEIVRHLSTPKDCDSFRRRITCVVNGEFSNIAVVEYCGCQPPGNLVQEPVRKKRRKYSRSNPQIFTNDTPETNTADVQESQEENKPVVNCEEVTCKPDLTSFQVNEENATQDILEVLAMLNKHPSVQEVNHLKNKAPCVILYTDEQIDDMKRNIKCGSIIGVDRTCDFGDCLVTFTVYKNHRVLHQDSSVYPLFPGPAYLHWDENFETYHYFFAHLQTLLADTLCDFDIRLGNNLDMSLIKVIRSCFPTSVLMLCSEQLKKNFTTFLSEEGQYQDKGEVLCDMVFGDEGVTASPDETSFKNRAMGVLLDLHEFPVVKDYFNMLTPLLLTYVCEPYQKGYCRGLWINGCTSVNALHQLSLDERQKRFPALINVICDTMTSQMLDLREALCGGKSQDLVPAFEKQVDRNEWMKKKEDEKVEFFKEYLKNELQ